MSTPYLGEIRLMSFSFPPKNWAFCNGQLLAIAQNQALFSLLGTMYGGNGTTTFGLPNLQGRVPLHSGGNGGAYPPGTVGGEYAHTLTLSELPAHTHTLAAQTATGATADPTGGVLAGAPDVYSGATDSVALSAASITNIGGSQAHNNVQPYLVVSYCIALTGIFPSQS